MFGNDMTQDDLRRLYDATIVDENGDKVGGVGQIYLDDQNDRPTWATAKTGLFGTKETFVPLQEAQLSESEIRVPYTKDFIKDAPHIDAEHHISEQEEDELYRYYNIGQGTNTAGVAGTAGAAGVAGAAGRGTDPDHGADGGADRGAEFSKQNVDPDHGADGGADRGAEFSKQNVDPDHGADGGADRGAEFSKQNVDPDHGADGGADRGAQFSKQNVDPDHGADGGADRGAGGDSVVRREEELRVGTERVETGRVRLRKHVVTEQETVTVPVEREEVRIEREPVSDRANVGRIGDDAEEVEVTLHEDRPVVEKETVAKERIGLDTNTVRGEERVTEEVRKEQVEVDQDGVRGDGVRGDGVRDDRV